MNQNGYDPRNRAPNGQQNIYTQNGYPGPAGGYAASGINRTGSFQPGVPGYRTGNTRAQTGEPGNPAGNSFSRTGNGYPANGYPAGGYPANGYQAPNPVNSAAVPGYPPAGNGYAGVPGSNTGNMNPPYGGYPPAQNSGQYSAVPGYPPQSGNGYNTGNYYTGYPAAQPGYSYSNPGYPGANQAQPVPGGSFIPQTPYSPGYTSPGYQTPGSGTGPQGYSAYSQMGRAPQSNAGQDGYIQQMPLNGGGYVPQPVPVRKAPFVLTDIMLIAAGAVLAILFVLAVLVTRSVPLKVVFLILAAGTTAALWIRPLTASNKRLCYTVVALALCIATVISLIPVQSQNRDATRTPSAGGNSSSAGTIVAQPQIDSSLYGGSAGNTAADPAPAPAAEQEPSADAEITERLSSFFVFWRGNQLEEMLPLCSPAWQSKQESPRKSLFNLLQNRTPKDFTLENISGTSEDNSRQITLTCTIDKNDGKPTVKYRLNVLMVKEGGVWYVDPKSLLTNEKITTPDPNVTPTPAPTEAPYVDANTVLYYNPNGGELYHLDPNCKIIHARYLPLKGHFTYSQINDPQYAGLKPCNVCGAPLR